MKFNKYLFSTLALLALLIGPAANAQSAGVYKILTGGTTRILAASTNTVALGVASTNTYGAPGTATNLVQAVGEYDYAGLTWSYGAGSNVTVQVFKSFDNGTTYEANPSFSYASQLNATTGWKTNASLDVHGVTHLAFVIQNPGTLDCTNSLLEINLKQPKVWTKPSTY